MPRLTPLPWDKLVRVFELDGFAVERVTASHVVLSRAGVARPVIIPKYPEVGLDIIRNNMRTARMSRERFFSLLDLS